MSGPQLVCPACKAPNEAGSVTCKRCGEIMSRKGKPPGKRNSDVPEFDATQGQLSPGCIAIPIGIIVLIALIFFLSFKGPTPCDHNREIIARAILKYDKGHPNDKLMNIDSDKLKQNDSKGKPYLKEVPTCPVDSGTKYEYDGHLVSCPHCSKKKK